MTWRSAINDVTTILVIATCGLVVWSVVVRGPESTSTRAEQRASIPTEPIEIGNDAALGNERAPVVLLEYSDFQCPFCVAFARDTFDVIKREFVDSAKVQVVYRHFPLSALHPYARLAAVAAECARQHGSFWPMHDALFANPRDLDQDALQAHATSVGLEPDRFRQCLLTDKGARERVDKQADDARRLGVSGTPTFLVGIRTGNGRVQVVDAITGGMSSPWPVITAEGAWTPGLRGA